MVYYLFKSGSNRGFATATSWWTSSSSSTLFSKSNCDTRTRHDNDKTIDQKKQRQQRQTFEIFEMKTLFSNHLLKSDFKILLIGPKCSGKTSLLARFLGQSFDQRIKPTIGFNLMTLDLAYEDHLINVELWDTAGSQTCPLSNGQFYYRDVQLVIAVFDMNDSTNSSFRDCSLWIKDFLKNCPNQKNAKIMVVANKIDQNDDGTMVQHLNHPKIMEYVQKIDATLYRTSAKTLEGTERLFDDVTKFIIDSYTKQQVQQQQQRQRQDDRSTWTSSLEESIQTWCLIAPDLSEHQIETSKTIGALFSEQPDSDPFNGQLNLSQPTKSGGGSRRTKTHPLHMTFAMFLRKIFCLL